MGRHWARGRACAGRRRRRDDWPPLGPRRSSTMSRIRPRSTCLDQCDHRRYDALPASRSISA
eukprot:7325980-Pyramimonas_sp.AAC.1